MIDRSRKILLAAAALLAPLGIGCPGRDLGPVTPLVQTGSKFLITQPESDAVDLLVMVDNSNSMAQEQENLTENFQVLLETLTAENDDGEPLVGDLHVGVISTDMGTGGFAVQTCLDSLDGDDGILRDTPTGAVSGCGDDYPSFLSFATGADAVTLNDDFACLATLGTGGCGFEQQLKAVDKALRVHAQDGGANSGFLRENSLLAILMVTDEEDCSVREDVPNASDIFNTQLSLGPLNLRCYNHRDTYVEPVDTYVDHVLGLRPNNPERLVVAAIVGVPPAGRNPCNLSAMSDADFQCLLDLPDMQEVIDNSAEGRGERLTPSCDEVATGEAFPPRRIVEFVRGISAAGSHNGIVRSICDADFRPAMQAIADLIAEKIDEACLARPLDVSETGQVQCIIQEQMATADPCGPGRIDLQLDGEGHRICQICQEGDGLPGRLVDELNTDLEPCAPFNESGDFWRYVPAEAAPDCEGRPKIEFRGGSIPGPGSTASLECLSQIGQ